MTVFYIEMGEVSGEYRGADRAEALDAFARDAGYETWANACEQGLASDDATTVVQIDVDALTQAVSTVTGKAVFQDAYGNGVALIDGESIATYADLAAHAGRKVWEFRA